MDYGHAVQPNELESNLSPEPQRPISFESDLFDTAITPGVGNHPENSNPNPEGSLNTNPYISNQVLGAKTLNIDPFLPPDRQPGMASVAGITGANIANNPSEIGQKATPELGQIVDLTPPQLQEASPTPSTEAQSSPESIRKANGKIGQSAVNAIIEALGKDAGSSYEDFQNMREGNK